MSKSAHERIFDAFVRSGSRIHSVAGRPDLIITEQEKEAMRAAVRVTADDAWEWYWGFGDGSWNWAEFGPLRMPFRHMWIEGAMPARLLGDGTNPDRYEQWDSGVHVVEYTVAEIDGMSDAMRKLILTHGPVPPGTARVIHLAQLLLHNGVIKTLDVNATILVDEEGAPLRASQGAMNDEVGAGALTEVMPAMLAVSLMNCKNISLEHHQPSPIRHKKSTRVRPAMLSYHTIELPARAGGGKSAKSAALGGPIPFHKVRGHFKTFTPERPLLGQHVGTYWWGWQARGRTEHGTVISDYEVSR